MTWQITFGGHVDNQANEDATMTWQITFGGHVGNQAEEDAVVKEAMRFAETVGATWANVTTTFRGSGTLQVLGTQVNAAAAAAAPDNPPDAGSETTPSTTATSDSPPPTDGAPQGTVDETPAAPPTPSVGENPTDGSGVILDQPVAQPTNEGTN